MKVLKFCKHAGNAYKTKAKLGPFGPRCAKFPKSLEMWSPKTSPSHICIYTPSHGSRILSSFLDSLRFLVIKMEKNWQQMIFFCILKSVFKKCWAKKRMFLRANFWEHFKCISKTTFLRKILKNVFKSVFKLSFKDFFKERFE